ncbi:putative invertase inhibitor [Pistacia vera]|uniref:putative invertase inhibitor n=1 Tax=Pistacia vera TaxID=55513 RepID=UPI0012632240|nr:putative invertase inhibitor [Pistacia vera]
MAVTKPKQRRKTKELMGLRLRKDGRPLCNNCSTSPLSLLFFFFFSDHLITAHDLVHQTCKKCTQNDLNLNYSFCVTSLEAVPSSHCANLRQLGMVSINLTRRNVANTRSYINDLLKNKKLDPFMSSCLTDCYEIYSDVISILQQAIKDYKSKHYEDTNFEISSVMDASTTCEDGFKEQEGVASYNRNNNSFQLSAIALSMGSAATETTARFRRRRKKKAEPRMRSSTLLFQWLLP